MSAAKKRRGRPSKYGFSGMSIDQLRALYLREIGRSTGSTDRRYLEWKLREARKGHVRVGPSNRVMFPGEPTELIGLVVSSRLAAALSAAAKRHGHPSRSSFLMHAVHDWINDADSADRNLRLDISDAYRASWRESTR